jgi:soluble cytochrome b562
MDEKIVKVTLLEGSEEKVLESREGGSAGFAHLERLSSRLVEVEKLLDEVKVKLLEAEAELKEFRERSQLERRFSELTGSSFKDLTPELEQKVKNLQAEVERLTSERAKLRNEILTGLSNVIVPVEMDGSVEAIEDGTFFKFRDGAKYPNITAFLKRELKFGNPPVYVTINSEGMKVVGLTDRTAAIKELVNAIENIRAKAASMIPKTQQTTQPETEVEEDSSGIFKKAKKRLSAPF